MIPELGRSPGVGNGNLLQYSCLKNPMDREAWWAIVRVILKSQTQIEHTQTHTQLWHRVGKWQKEKNQFFKRVLIMQINPVFKCRDHVDQSSF